MSLVATALTRRFEGVAHLDGVSCALERGRFYVIVGPTMSGKTSLLHALAGLSALDAGTVVLDGKDLADVPVWARSASMVYQQFINYPHLSVFENIAFPAAPATRGARGTRAQGARDGRDGRLDAAAGAPAGRAFRRAAAARGPRPLAGQGIGSPAPGRTAGQPRLQAARAAARGVSQHLQRAGPLDRRLHDGRPQRGPSVRCRGARDARRAAAADRLGKERVRAPGHDHRGPDLQ